MHKLNRQLEMQSFGIYNIMKSTKRIKSSTQYMHTHYPKRFHKFLSCSKNQSTEADLISGGVEENLASSKPT